jgi:hypothetical protein
MLHGALIFTGNLSNGDTHMKRITFPFTLCIFALCAQLFLSCSSVPVVPPDLAWDYSKHTHIRTMQGHLLRIESVNGVKTDSVCNVKTRPGPGTVTVKNDEPGGPACMGCLKFREQKVDLQFQFLPGSSHYIQYMLHTKSKLINIWQYSHDYISHSRETPVFTFDAGKKDAPAKRTVNGSLEDIHRRFLNELLLQEYRHEIIGTSFISLMFYSEKEVNGYKITVNKPGTGIVNPARNEEDYKIMGVYTFTQLPANRVEISLKCENYYLGRYEKFITHVFTHFDPAHRQVVKETSY